MVDDTAPRDVEPGPLLQVVDVDCGGRRAAFPGRPRTASGGTRRGTRTCGAGTSVPPAAVDRSCPAARCRSSKTSGSRWSEACRGEFGLEGSYRTGEHWTVAARTLDGDVEWPEADGQRVLLPPFGPDEHLAALTWFQLSGEAQDLRMQFEPIAKPV